MFRRKRFTHPHFQFCKVVYWERILNKKVPSVSRGPKGKSNVKRETVEGDRIGSPADYWLRIREEGMRWLFIYSLLTALILSLSQSAIADRYQYPLGDISQAQLLERHEVFKRNYDAYEVTAGIDGLPTDLKVKILFGTWCHDSEREVPRMLKLLAASGVKEENISLISLDIRKEEPEGRAKALDVRFTPTFIFFRGDIELGRIIERPVESLHADVAAMVGLSD
jgi:thioredoxin 1